MGLWGFGYLGCWLWVLVWIFRLAAGSAGGLGGESGGTSPAAVGMGGIEAGMAAAVAAA